MRASLYGTALAVVLTACGQSHVPLLPSFGNAIAPHIVSHHLHAISFFSFRGNKDGEEPVPGLVGDSSDNLYGVLKAGGNPACTAQKPAGCGVIYQLTHVNGLQYTESVVHAFDGKDGANPDAPLIGSNGVFFGTAWSGGAHNVGVVYQITVASKRLRVLHSFSGGSSDGASPIGKLYMDAKGNLFGTTALGGGGTCAGGCGTVFELERTGSTYSEKLLYRFKGGSDGWEPWAGVSFYNGALYGTTIYGGNSACKEGCGTVFQLSTGSTAAKKILHAFGGDADGAYVRSPLYVDGSGNLYGETQNGGNTACTIAAADAAGCGTIFIVKANGRTAIVHKFVGGYYGAQPNTGLTLYKNVLYGTTNFGGSAANCGPGAPGCGVAFNIDLSGLGFGVIGAFSSAKTTAPLNPAIFHCAITGELNGVTSSGGKYGYGTIFKLNP